MRKKIWLVLCTLFALTFVLCFQNCGTELGDPTLTKKIKINLSNYDSDPVAWLAILPKAYADVAVLKMCVLQIQIFKTNATSGDNQTVNVDQLIEVSPAGTFVIEATVSGGVYNRIDIKLRDTCGNGQSLYLENDNGAFSDSRPITLRFNGEFVVDSQADEATLGVQPFVDFLDTVGAMTDIATGINVINGDLE